MRRKNAQSHDNAIEMCLKKSLLKSPPASPGVAEVGEPVVSAIVICRNEEAYIDKCLEGICAQSGMSDRLEIIVVDGMSTDGTRAIVNSWQARDSRVRLIDNPRRIVPSGLNEGIRQARGEFIAVISAHAEYANDYFVQCQRTVSETGADNVGGPAEARGQGYVQQTVALAFNSPYSSGGARWHDLEYAGYVDTTATGFYRRSRLLEIGLYDEELVRNQDDELNLRLIRSGGKIYQNPKIRYVYYPRESLGKLFGQYLQYGYWKVRVIQKHRVPASVRHLVPALALLLAITLATAGFLVEKAWIALAALGTVYVLGTFAATVQICLKRGVWRPAPLLPVVLACCHLGYGLGFMMGFIDFVLLRRGGRRAFAVLTR